MLSSGQKMKNIEVVHRRQFSTQTSKILWVQQQKYCRKFHIKKLEFRSIFRAPVPKNEVTFSKSSRGHTFRCGEVRSWSCNNKGMPENLSHNFLGLGDFLPPPDSSRWLTLRSSRNQFWRGKVTLCKNRNVPEKFAWKFWGPGDFWPGLQKRLNFKLFKSHNFRHEGTRLNLCDKRNMRKF